MTSFLSQSLLSPLPLLLLSILLLYLPIPFSSRPIPHTPKPILSQPSDTHHLVIARWKENLTWVRDYFPHGSVTVIQKKEGGNHYMIHQEMAKGSFSHESLTLTGTGEEREWVYPFDIPSDLSVEYVHNMVSVNLIVYLLLFFFR